MPVLMLAALTLPPAFAETPMDLRFGKPAIELKLNGRGPWWFLLDSGAAPNLIVDEDLAVELGLPVVGEDAVGDPTNPHAIPVKKVRVDRVEALGQVLDGVEALSWDRPLYRGDDRPRGVLGLGLFGDGMLVTLDYPAGRVRLEKGELPLPDGITVLEAPLEHGIPQVRIDVAGKPYTAHLDTGSTGFLSMPLALSKELPLAGGLTEVGRAHSVNREYIVYAAPLAGSFKLGALTVENPTVHFMESFHPNVGTDLLRNLAITIDRKNQRLRVVSDGRPIVSSARPRLGIRTKGMQDGRIPIEGVVPGSPAEKAGLRAGDAILRINGQAVAPMKPGDVALAMRATPVRFTLLRDGAEMDVELSLPPEAR
ncbi:MAG: aspartyl protease family protein [Candidatus Polarisedimenticolia bacterium]